MLYSLNEIYASGGQLPLTTLDIANATIGDLHFILAQKNTFLNNVEYEATGMSVQLGERSDNGFSDLQFGVCNVNARCYEYIQKVLAEQTTTYITISQWHPISLELLTDLTLTITGGQITREQALFTASYCDMLNCEFPKLRYTATTAPGLKYVS